MLLIGTQINEKYIWCGAIASPKIYPDVEEREREAKTEGEARRGSGGDDLPALAARQKT